MDILQPFLRHTLKVTIIPLEEEEDLVEHFEVLQRGIICEFSLFSSHSRGRGFYSAGRGRGETGEPSVPTQSPSESNPQENTVSNNPETNNEVHEPNESVSAQNVDSSTFPTRGRFRGRASGFRGRGRLAGRAIRGRNKTWVRGPGVETPLTTDR